MTRALLKIAVVLPRNMSFGPKQATSIDLCVHDYLTASRNRETACVFAEPVAEPYGDVAVRQVGPGTSFVEAVRAFSPDVVLVEQYRPAAVALARALAPVPVVLRRHGLERPANALRRWRIGRDFARLAGIIAVSHTVAETLRPLAPASLPIEVVHNALDFSLWRPAAQRDPTILFVGRAAPEKGLDEAAGAAALVLAARPGWSARFILAAAEEHAAYTEAALARLEPFGGRVAVERDVPHSVVKAAFEHAAIALVPSLWVEPFGRTALEAFAGGAALIASRRGGLMEVVGTDENCAILTEDTSSRRLSELTLSLIDNDGARGAYTRAARARGEALFSLSTHADRIDDFLGGLARTGPAGPTR